VINIKKLVIIFAFVLLNFLLVVYVRQANATPPAQVTICHATGSASNPYTTIHVSENAISGHFENNGTPKSGHEDDLLLQGTVDCPSPSPSPSASVGVSPSPSISPSPEASASPSSSPSSTPQGGCCSPTSGESFTNDGKPTYDPNDPARGGVLPSAPPATGRG
jgi:hypothetical protein